MTVCNFVAQVVDNRQRTGAPFLHPGREKGNAGANRAGPKHRAPEDCHSQLVDEGDEGVPPLQPPAVPPKWGAP